MASFFYPDNLFPDGWQQRGQADFILDNNYLMAIHFLGSPSPLRRGNIYWFLPFATLHNCVGFWLIYPLSQHKDSIF